MVKQKKNYLKSSDLQFSEIMERITMFQYFNTQHYDLILVSNNLNFEKHALNSTLS